MVRWACDGEALVKHDQKNMTKNIRDKEHNTQPLRLVIQCLVQCRFLQGQIPGGSCQGLSCSWAGPVGPSFSPAGGSRRLPLLGLLLLLPLLPSAPSGPTWTPRGPHAFLHMPGRPQSAISQALTSNEQAGPETAAVPQDRQVKAGWRRAGQEPRRSPRR